ncbi:MAG: hypothetical protein PHN41_00790 [Bacteroidales bacterium]|jgi:tyrosine-protein phosphatase YwqE|nr:hypothetical protein [Bacteroidales bacterium]MDD4703041.1 hypothetical protein [Bacteroidales bacterium]MDX9797357.1 CpsB/CapC family capsule biosynthesis tyrosine phosphatase [Bacteroidales bacterium]
MFSFFGRKSKKLDEIIDLSVVGTDLHSHLIPGVDDGSQSFEESISLLKQLKELGYKKVITTPHIYYDSYLDGYDVLYNKLEELRSLAKENVIDIEIILGGEFLLDDDISDRVKKNQIISFGDNYLLFEFPMQTEPMGYEEWLFDLQLAGYNLIMAHPERYSFLNKDIKKYSALKDRGILFQINIASFSGYYGERIQKIAESMAAENMIDLIGSDCHGQRHIEALKKSLDNPVFKKLINSGRLLNHKL